MGMNPTGKATDKPDEPAEAMEVAWSKAGFGNLRDTHKKIKRQVLEDRVKIKPRYAWNVLDGVRVASREMVEMAREAARQGRDQAGEEGGWGGDAARLMLHAAMEQRADVMEWLHEIRGAELYITDEKGFTAMHFVAMAGDVEQMEMLADRGADIRAVDHEGGNTPFMLALINGHDEAADWLAHHQPDVHRAPAEDGSLPMHWAAKFNQMQSMNLLRELGAGVHDTDNAGNTPLHWAAREDASEAMLWLAREGADLRAKNHLGETPLDLAPPKTSQWFADWLEKQPKGPPAP